MVRFVCFVAAVLMAHTVLAQSASAQCVGGKCLRQSQQPYYAQAPQVHQQGYVQQSHYAQAPQQCIGGKCYPGGLAQTKADYMASHGVRGHVMRGQFGGASAEGVGWGSTPQAAISNSCYWGQRTPVEIGVAQRGGMYYATVLYR